MISEGSWGAAIADMIGAPSPFALSIDTFSIQAGRINTDVRLHLAQPVLGDYNIVVYLVEDHIQDWQLDAEATPPDVPDYDHRHMLRANLNDTWGTRVINGSAPAGRVVRLSIDNYRFSSAWNATNFYLVAWLYNTETDEIFQVAERKYQP